MQNRKTIGIVLIGAGVLFLTAGESIAGIGDAIDSLVKSKWVSVGLIVVGVITFASSTKVAEKL